eukprot:TRINITY_DN20749_c0_g1_i3.p1 TRINITY_DN20749_c0_g1~~TRINITY_DN20749_c0_g1_i3.p1  ORF type:complete len:101 (-),score=3.90 TRINITY_DN20749_c0_g1_i3:29-331(-)
MRVALPFYTGLGAPDGNPQRAFQIEPRSALTRMSRPDGCIRHIASRHIPERHRRPKRRARPGIGRPHDGRGAVADRIKPFEIGRAVQQECRDRSRMPSSA